MLSPTTPSASTDRKKMVLVLLVCSFWALASLLLFLRAIQPHETVRTVLASVGLAISILFVIGVLLQFSKHR